jgi:hypothetical protein
MRERLSFEPNSTEDRWDENHWGDDKTVDDRIAQ